MLILLGAVLAIGIFILDLLLPLGVAASIAYVGLVLISLWLSGSPSTYVAAVVGTILNLLGLTLSVPGGIEWMVLTNRSLALILIWAAAVIVLQRKQTQEELVRAGRRLGERVIRAAPNLIYIYNLRTARLIYANPEVLRRLHSSADSLDTLDFANLRVHPDDVDHVKAQFARCDALSDDETLHVTCRILHPSGELLWYSARHVVFSRDPDGSAREILGVAEDTTDRESARDALGRSAAELRLLALRLISIQEEERKRVAREIHDNISQHMAAAAIQTSKLARDLPANPDKLRHTLQSLGREIGAVSDELHRLSHQLHPSVLENLGLEATLEAECSTFAKREGIPVSFQAGRIPEQIPPDVALCLYRVAQESFRNIARHARAAKVEVTLCLAEDAILLRVKDSGKGFRIEDAKRRGGVGLTSMQERTRLIGASLELISEPGAGAEVRVLAPLLEVER